MSTTEPAPTENTTKSKNEEKKSEFTKTVTMAEVGILLSLNTMINIKILMYSGSS